MTESSYNLMFIEIELKAKLYTEKAAINPQNKID